MLLLVEGGWDTMLSWQFAGDLCDMATLCDACQVNQASDHITLQVSIANSTRTKTKIVQFWLCEDCERSSQQILSRDDLQRQRVAFRFVDNPSFMSPSGRWRKKGLRKPAIHV